jgi:hypothetical protein
MLKKCSNLATMTTIMLSTNTGTAPLLSANAGVIAPM